MTLQDEIKLTCPACKGSGTLEGGAEVSCSDSEVADYPEHKCEHCFFGEIEVQQEDLWEERIDMDMFKFIFTFNKVLMEEGFEHLDEVFMKEQSNKIIEQVRGSLV